MLIKNEVIAELEGIVDLLEINQIDYIVSGSLAMNTYMVPRFTRDVDIVLNLTKKSSQVFFAHFRNSFYLNETEANKQIEQAGFFNAISFATGYKYDFILQQNEEYERQKFERKVRLQIFNIIAWVISVEDLIISKLQWMQQTESVMQKNDIFALLEETKPDLNYIHLWIQKLSLKTFGIFA
jgi:hypothetical protein